MGRRTKWASDDGHVLRECFAISNIVVHFVAHYESHALRVGASWFR